MQNKIGSLSIHDGQKQVGDLASFPEFNPGPVVEIYESGEVQYMNAAAKHLFPDLSTLGLEHPFIKGMESIYKQISTTNESKVVREVSVQNQYYLQTIVKIPGTKVFRLYCVDITEQKKYQMEREQFFRFFKLSTDIMVIADPNGTFKKVNPMCLSTLGYSEKELISKPFIDFVHAEDKQSTLDEMARQIQAGSTLDFENRYVCKDGSVLWLSWRAIYDKGEGITYATARNITERKIAEREITRTNRALRMVSLINQALIHSQDEMGLLNETCRIATEDGGFRLAWVGFSEMNKEKTVRVIAKSGLGIQYLDSIRVTWADNEFGRGPTGTAIRTGHTQTSRNILEDPKMKPWRQNAMKHGLKSSIALPLRVDGQVIGALTVYAGEAEAFSEEEIRILEELAGDLAFGISAIRIRIAREQMEDIVHKNVEQLKEAQRIGHIGSWEWNAITDTITWTEELYNIMGYDVKNPPPNYKQHLQLYTQESQGRLDEAVKKVMQTGGSYELDLEQVPREGKKYWLIARGETVHDAQGKIIGLRGTAQDNTKRKLDHIELDRMNRALYLLGETNQALIHATDEKKLFETISQIIVEKGGYQLLWIGEAQKDDAKTVLPVAQAGFGTDYLQYAQISWGDNKMGQGPTGVAIRTGKIQVARNILQDPKMTPWRAAAVQRGYKSSIALPLKTDGETFGALNIYANEIDAFSEGEIAILEELTNDLAYGVMTLRLRKQVEARTKEVDQLKNKFIQIVSHQLRTPLTVIRWNLGAILGHERGEVPVALTESLRSAYDADIEIISRIDDLLMAIDIEEGRLRLDLEDVDIGELLQSVSEEKLQPASLKNITFTVLPSKKSLPHIHADASKIRDTVARLIDNAIAYTNENGHIEVRYSLNKDKIRFEISDTGVGIPVSEQPHIFERFHRGWNAALMRADASGLSLYISKHIVESHRGSIGFTSVEKKGSTFWFELPAV